MTAACGCKCACHADEQSPIWPGPCAACCEPGMDCRCGRALASLLPERDQSPEYKAAYAQAMTDSVVLSLMERIETIRTGVRDWLDDPLRGYLDDRDRDSLEYLIR